MSGHSCGGAAFRISVKAAIGIPKSYPSTLRFNQRVFSLYRELQNQPFIIEPSILTSRFSKYAIDHLDSNPIGFFKAGRVFLRHSLSTAATSEVFKKNAKPIAITFLVQSRVLRASLLHFSIIVNSHLRTHHRCLAIEIVHPVPLCCQLRGEEIDTRRVASWSSGRKVK